MPTIEVGPTVIGWASYYAEGVFQSVIDQHYEFAPYPAGLKPHQAAAVASCRLKRDGTELYVRPLDAETDEPLGDWMPLYVVDCAGDPATAAWMADNNIVIEIDESLWRAWSPYRSRERGLRVEVFVIEYERAP